MVYLHDIRVYIGAYMAMKVYKGCIIRDGRTASLTYIVMKVYKRCIKGV